MGVVFSSHTYQTFPRHNFGIFLVSGIFYPQKSTLKTQNPSSSSLSLPAISSQLFHEPDPTTAESMHFQIIFLLAIVRSDAQKSDHEASKAFALQPFSSRRFANGHPTAGVAEG